MREERGYLQIALDVHMTTTGSMERPDEEQAADIAVLKEHLAKWEKGLTRFAGFDYACKAVILQALIDVQ